MAIILKWYNITEYCNIETGELISKAEVDRKEYRRIEKVEETEVIKEKNYAIKKTVWKCRRHEQYKLNF